MGHTRLGELPRTRKWAQVVALIEGGAGTAQTANAIITAAERGLNFASEDKGFGEAIWLLSQLPFAASQNSFATTLRNAGLDFSDSRGLMEVVGAVFDAIERPVNGNRAQGSE